MNSADEIVLVLIGLGSLLVGVVVWLILPIISWVRVSRVKGQLDDLQSRLAALEAAGTARATRWRPR